MSTIFPWYVGITMLLFLLKIKNDFVYVSLPVSPVATYSNEPSWTSSKKLNVEPEIRFSHSPVITLENETLFSFARVYDCYVWGIVKKSS